MNKVDRWNNGVSVPLDFCVKIAEAGLMREFAFYMANARRLGASEMYDALFHEMQQITGYPRDDSDDDSPLLIKASSICPMLYEQCGKVFDKLDSVHVSLEKESEKPQ